MKTQGHVRLDKVDIIGNRIDYFFSVSDDLKKFFEDELHMFVEYEENIENIPLSILVIPFVANIMPLMWITNCILWIEEIDREYYDSLKQIKNAYQDMYFSYKLGGVIVPVKVITNKYEVKRPAAQLFSGGLDSIATCIRIVGKNPLLINIYGWYKNKIIQNDVFDSDKKNITDFGIKNNLETKFVKSNFATFIISKEVDKKYSKKLKSSWWFGLQHGMSFIGHAIPLAYKYNVENIYIASSYSLGEERGSCSSDPVVDIEIKYSSGGVIHDGFELIRQDKIRLVVKKQNEINDKYTLRVCSFNDRNCCKCEKCFRTILGLVAEGKSKKELEQFDFYIDKELKEHFSELMDEKIHLFGVDEEYNDYWIDIKKRILENKNNITEEEFVKWFLGYNFFKQRKRAVLRYRITNIVPILKRKIFGENKQ
ncbi:MULTISPECIES: peptidase [Psychrilyobacter]|uniref:Peptidase n=1 Tax=Psychrilyobacter piezotolerans TaxID=2293438 RepID=A0ABX9KHQ6_9FUSO|nr:MULTISPECIES: peptidase [Psychrilyobacter]MCS5420920.1 hypothetical protein [Psychrilyobacter sp. S5]NDI77676.1 peptidase [Psychrilyobacter piezotolerans]RDE62682.1 peptidase [Psychrilyobacter sp. S5]REI41612.1 peptidase [Psychrilyobacter piezotolerans]